MPHPSTLAKITTRCGPEAIEALNQALLIKAAEEKAVKLDKVRADNTVVPANVAYPTDSGLLVRAIALIVALVARIHAAGAAWRTGVRVTDHGSVETATGRVVNPTARPVA